MNNQSTTIETHLARLGRDAPSNLLRAVELGIGITDGYAVFESPVGEVMVAFNPEGVSAVDLIEPGFEERFASRFGRGLAPASPPSAWGRSIGKALEQGRFGVVPIDFRSVTRFQQSILQIAGTIPKGEVRPYSWLARMAGRPGSVRAVGSTMARNPVPLIIPCHRVVRSDGTIGQYSLGGPESKWQLLDSEGASPDRLEDLAASGIRFLGSDTTGVFCYPTCRQASRITKRHLQTFNSMEEAKSKGYRPCKTCEPG